MSRIFANKSFPYELRNSPAYAQSSASSEPVSPSTSIPLRKSSPESKNLRLLEGLRSYSDQSRRQRIQVNSTKRISSHSQDSLELSSRNVTTYSPGQAALPRKTESEPPATSKDFLGQSPTEEINQNANSIADGTVLTEIPTPRPSRPKYHRQGWYRSRSGGIWYDRPKTPSSPDGSSSMHSYFGRTEILQEEAASPVVPLQPPINPHPRYPSPTRDHKVRMETSFTQLRPQGQEPVVQVPTSSSRKSSINPLRLFSSPFVLTNCSSPSRYKQSSTPVREPQSLDQPLSARGQSTTLGVPSTENVLNRVTSMLEHVSSSKIKPSVLRSMSAKSDEVRGCSDFSSGRNHVSSGITSPNCIFKRKSRENLTDIRSYSSSLVRLRMGSQPQNTPDEKATYKVKRSVSAETEEYLKLDISVRGATSYLPSEAQRIHTPPLPQKNCNGRRRGFFFDYNAPKRSGLVDAGSIDLLDSPRRINHHEEVGGKTLTRRFTFGRISSQQHKRQGTKAKTGEWYDTALAVLDADTESPKDQSPISLTRPRSPTCMSETTKIEMERQLDYTIPEHLPSSPLCPKHPRYWRIVDRRGSQFRGCWIHGFGLDEMADTSIVRNIFLKEFESSVDPHE